MAETLEKSEDLGLAFLGLELYRLLAVIDEQGDALLAGRGLKAPSKAASLLLFLEREGATSITEVGRFLAMSHQLVALRVDPLLKAGLISKSPSPHDRRRSLLSLTEDGKHQCALLIDVCAETAKVYREMFGEIGCDVYAGLLNFRQALEKKPLAVRLENTEVL